MKNYTHVVGICLLILWTLTVCAQSGSPGAASAPDGNSKLTPASEEAVPPCAPTLTTGSSKDSQGSQSSHSVTVSWKASLPPSKSDKDSIQGYYVYRSRTSRKYATGDRLNSEPITGTRCIDGNVEPRAIYFYSVKSVSRRGTQSAFSDEIKAVIPFP